MTENISIDHMTGLMTRPAFVEALEGAMKSSKILSLAMLDIDNFMRVNEELGNAVGDRVIKTLGEWLGRWAQSHGAMAARIAGDEFALIMPGMSLEKAFLKLEELRKELTGPTFFGTLGDMGGIDGFSACIGVANCPRDAKDSTVLMRMADEALYSCKEGPRDCVALPTSQQEMVLKSCHYSVMQLRKLKILAEKQGEKESVLLREALEDVLRKYDVK